ncbi:MAG: hypothetical protein U9N52_02785 [Campylobacterota bacterium]|nr:hypothetical protein [Campylobacterota bacterium]
MTKESILESIENIKQTHRLNLKYIDFCIKGLPLKERPIALHHTECSVHQWINGEEVALIKGLQDDILREITLLHEQWHEEYAKIYAIHYPEGKKKGLLGKLFKKKKELTPMELEKAKAYYNDLQNTSALLIKKLDSLIRRVNANNFG